MTVTGVVLDANTGAPVAGVFVAFGERGPRGISTPEGTFRIANVLPGEHTVHVQGFGYHLYALPVRIVNPPEPLEIRLTPDPVAIEGLVVRGGARVPLSGVVLDASTGERLPYAATWLSRDAVRETAMADADHDGVFHMRDIETGEYFLLVERMGYEKQMLLVEVMAPPEPLEVRLEPDTALQRGAEDFMRDLRARRNANPNNARRYDERHLRYSGASGMRQFLEWDASMTLVPCSADTGYCMTVRGREVNPPVFLDEMRLFGGILQLDSYSPRDFYSVEVITCRNNVQVRAYTHDFIERMARQPRATLPSC